MTLQHQSIHFDAALDIIAPRNDDPDRLEEIATAAAQAVKQLLGAQA